MKKTVVILYTFITGLLLFCTQPNDALLGLENLQEGNGIVAYYHFLKMPEEKRNTEKMKRWVIYSRELAEIELNSIFIIPDDFDADMVYIDTAQMKHVRFIVNNDPGLKNTFGSYLKKIDNGEIRVRH